MMAIYSLQLCVMCHIMCQQHLQHAGSKQKQSNNNILQSSENNVQVKPEIVNPRYT